MELKFFLIIGGKL